MSLQIRWINHASFRLADEGNVVYIDPWKLPSATNDADVVFVSHSHYDHCSAEDIRKVSNDETTLVAPEETIAQLHAANALTPGESIWIKDITIEGVAAYNIGKKFHPKANNWVGAVVTIAGQRVYYAGDTDLIPEMSELTDVDVALLPVGGTYTLDARQAARAAKAIGCRIAIPYHWGDIVGEQSDADAFANEAADICEVRILQPGEETTI